MVVQFLADVVLQQTDVVQGLIFGIADVFDEVLDGLGRVATTTQTAQGRHTRVIPTGHEAFLDELQQLALAHHGVSEV